MSSSHQNIRWCFWHSTLFQRGCVCKCVVLYTQRFLCYETPQHPGIQPWLQVQPLCGHFPKEDTSEDSVGQPACLALHNHWVIIRPNLPKAATSLFRFMDTADHQNVQLANKSTLAIQGQLVADRITEKATPSTKPFHPGVACTTFPTNL